MKEVIRLQIHQPTAHFRVPFSYQRRFTYPLPPFSAIKGLLCNLMGIREESADFKEMMNGLSLAVSGKYQSIVKEYVWLRNLSAKSHKSKYHSLDNRTLDDMPGHPGGQTPARVDTLNECDFMVYIFHNNEEFQKQIFQTLKNPLNRTSHPHLGRSEDWLVFEEIKTVELQLKSVRKNSLFSWIPDNEAVDKELLPEATKKSYKEEFFEPLSGNLLKMPIYYQITDNNERVFNQFVRVKLFEGGGFGRKHEFMVDEESDNLPVIFTRIRVNQNE